MCFELVMALEAFCADDVLREFDYSGGVGHHVLLITGPPAQTSLVEEAFSIIRRDD